MKNIIEFIKDKSYYFLGGTILLIVILVILNACSVGGYGSYDDIENSMVKAAKKYYETNKNLLPTQNDGTVKVTISTLIDAEVLDDFKDPKDSSKSCSGYVEVTKIDEEYSYMPFLTCEGNYEPEYLYEKVKTSGQDELGNGIYEMNGEYVYRGDDVDNYVKFENLLWRIVKVDSSNDVKLVLVTKLEENYAWDTSYNSSRKESTGNTTNYLITDIRKSLNQIYDSIIVSDKKALVVSKNLCVGKYAQNDNYSVEKECSVIKENEKIGLLNLTDFQRASLDTACVNLENGECINRNYMVESGEIRTWSLNATTENTYKVFNINSGISLSSAHNAKRINPVIYISSKAITNAGDGSMENPYIIK